MPKCTFHRYTYNIENLLHTFFLSVIYSSCISFFHIFYSAPMDDSSFFLKMKKIKNNDKNIKILQTTFMNFVRD